ncbi:MAG: HNH endonuclease signature motif containing protein, partial [Peristeroidobacter soli]
HHVDHWANGGETKPSNLVSLCRFHHHAVHEGGVRIEILDDGALRFVKANGVAIDVVAPGFTQPLGDWRQLPTATEPLARWKGDRMDYGLAVEVLLQQANRGKNVPAGTSICATEAAVRAAAAVAPSTPTP